MEFRPVQGIEILQRGDCPIQAASLLFFDIETTGLRRDRGARITELALVGRRGVLLNWVRTNGLPDDVSLHKQLTGLFRFFQTGVVVGHNVRFDLEFVLNEAGRLGCPCPSIRFIDTLGLARQGIAGVADYRLETLLKRFSLESAHTLHTARGDALATRDLFWKLVDCGKLNTLADAGMKPLSWITL